MVGANIDLLMVIHQNILLLSMFKGIHPPPPQITLQMKTRTGAGNARKSSPARGRPILLGICMLDARRPSHILPKSDGNLQYRASGHDQTLRMKQMPISTSASIIASISGLDMSA